MYSNLKSKLFQTSTQRLAKLKAQELTRLNRFLNFSECPRVFELHIVKNLKFYHLAYTLL